MFDARPGNVGWCHSSPYKVTHLSTGAIPSQPIEKRSRFDGFSNLSILGNLEGNRIGSQALLDFAFTFTLIT